MRHEQDLQVHEEQSTVSRSGKRCLPGGHPPGLRERDPQPRELAYRSNDGLEVTLFWRPGRDELTVCGSDHRSGASFKIRPERHLALDVYYHPYCYVTPNDISYEDHRRAA